MDIKLFNYNLPPDLIAQHPAKRRDQSRLMVLNRKTGSIEILQFKSIPDFLNKGDALVINNTRVFKSRLIGHRLSGAEVEVFLVREIKTSGKIKNAQRAWEALVRPTRRIKEGEQIWFDKKQFVTLVKNMGEGRWEISFPNMTAAKKVISKFGHVPLPHYISRPDSTDDFSRYQTVFARKDKAEAVAAPTAGLHFSTTLLKRLKAKGVKIVEITLNVGPGTFKPVNVDDIENHTIDPEWAELSAKAARVINNVRKYGGRVVAVGTTSVRTLESAMLKDGLITAFESPVKLYIKPGFDFKIVDALLTNFHLPKSSLLILVSALAGRERILKAYLQAIENKMRFYSYGDAMLIL